jgi:hypothetical protein
MFDGNRATYRQPQAGAVGLGGEKRPEHFPGGLLGHAGTAVDHGEFDACRITCCGNRDPSPFGRQVAYGIHGIAEQEQQESLQAGAITMDLRQRAGKIYNEPDVMVVGKWLDERQHFLNERIAVSCRAMHWKGANIATHTLDRVAGPQGLAGDLLDDFDCLGRLRGFASA